MGIHRYSGRVVERADQSGLKGLRIEARDAGRRVRTVVATGVTNDRGDFLLEADDGDLQKLFGRAQPILYFQVIDGLKVLASTERTLRWLALRDGQGRIELISDQPVAKRSSAPESVVEGVVGTRTGTTLGAGLTVQAKRRALRDDGTVEEILLGTATVASDGTYRIGYDPTGDITARPDLVVRALDGSLVLGTNTLRGAPPRATVDVVVGAAEGAFFPGVPRFSEAKRAVERLLEEVDGSLGVSGIQDSALDYVAGRAGLDRDHAEALVRAARLSEAHPSVPHEVFYAILRRGVRAEDVFRHRLSTLRQMLLSAARTGEVAPDIEDGIDDVLDGLETAAIAELAREGDSSRPFTSIGQLAMLTPGVDSSRRDALIGHSVRNQGGAEAFWQAVLDDTTRFDATQVASLKFSADVAPLVSSHPAMISKLHEQRTGGVVTLGKDVAKYTLAEWGAFIETTGVPLGTPGADTTEQKANYKNAIYAAVGARYRTARIASQQTGDLGVFFASSTNAGFDFAKHRVGAYLRATPAALAGVADATATTAALKQLERLYKITTTAEEMTALKAAGITSAAQLHGMSESAVASALPSLASTSLSRIMSAARWVAWGALGLHSKYAASVHQLVQTNNVLPDQASAAETFPQVPDWEDLFGSLDQCKCEHCRSVLSPSAYLVDVLQFMKGIPLGVSNARNVLLGRRPDIGRLALSCQNAETALPYVDLVNEILEVRIATAGGSWPSTPSVIDNPRTSEELLAQPEIVYEAEHVEAYRRLADGLFPLSMPFHLWAKEARVYLEHLGVPRHMLVTTLASSAGVDADCLAIERLDLAPKQYDLLADRIMPAAWEPWGFPATPSPSPDFDIQLRAVPELLRRTRLSYDELLEVLNTSFAVEAGVHFTGGSCDVDALTLTSSANAAWFATLHKLLRLRQTLGWRISLVAKAWTALLASQPAGTTWDAMLKALGALRLVAERTGAAPLELLSWYADMDHWDPGPASVGGYKAEPSLFGGLFLNTAVANPAEEALSAIGAGATDGTLGGHVLGLLPGLRITQSDFELLTATSLGELSLSPFVAASSPAAVKSVPGVPSSISRLFRGVSAARAIGLRVRDFMILHALAGVPALAGDTDEGDVAAKAEATLGLLDVAGRVAATGASYDEIHYVLRHVAPSSSAIEPTEALLAQWMADIEDGIGTIEAELSKLEDPTGDVLAKLARELLPAHAVDIERLADDDPTLLFADRVALLAGALKPYLESVASATTALVGDDGPPVVPPGVTEPSERRKYLATRLQRFVLISGLVKTWVASTFKISLDTADWILTGGGLTWASGAVNAVFAFTRQPGWTDAPLPTAEGRERLLLLLHKFGLLAARFKWTNAEVRALFPASAPLPSFDLSALPTARPSDDSDLSVSQARFAVWLRFAELSRLRESWGGGPEVFDTFLASTASLEAMDVAVSSATGWKVSDLAELRPRFGVSSPEQYKDERNLARLRDATALCKRLGTSAAQAIAWAEPTYALPTSLTGPPGSSLLVAREIKRVAKAKHGEASWDAVARPLRDVLREKQRATLVDYLISLDPDAETSNEVYADLLVDVEMSPCQLTSRMVLAHGTVQLFMQRALLNLEQPLQVSVDKAAQWRWMKNYRVWEANRKVFLWPENWIEPELRDDKTPLFKQLETNLLQGPLDADRAEDAYRRYLEGLSEIARLDIVGTHLEQVPMSTGGSVLHVFGKSRTNGKHYYRKRVKGQWLAWEKVDADIDTHHLLPVSFSGRLFLIWPQWTTRAAGGDPNVFDGALEELGVQLCWSERRGGGWTAPATGPGEFLWLGGSPDTKHLSLTFDQGSEGINIHLLGYAGSNATFLIAAFKLFPGTGEIVAQLRDPLKPSDADTRVHVQHEHASDYVIVPGPGGVHPEYQRFRGSSTDFFSSWLPDANGDPVYSLLFLGSFPSFIVTTDRRDEPTNAREVLFFDDGSRTFLLEHKDKPIVQSATPAPHHLASWAQLYHQSAETALPAATEAFYRASVFYHPYVKSFRTALARSGVDGLLRWSSQPGTKLQRQSAAIEDDYDPDATTLQAPFPREDVDFTFSGAYSVYNWELFFHGPLLIATRLMQDGRFEDAMKWFHYVFDPTDGSADEAPRRYWKVKPFYENDNLATIQSELEALTTSVANEMRGWASNETVTALADDLVAQIAVWRENPFDPHALARLRIVAYQKTVFLKYVQNLLGWGDQLFGQDSIESINQATQLYILAQELLGKRPQVIDNPSVAATKAYNDLTALDAFSNALIELESAVPPASAQVAIGDSHGVMPPALAAGTQYFCVPPNDRMFELWDVVADRLFKIRHCMNIEGVVRTLPLFQPPIDPALLVRAVAAGVDIGSVLNDLNAAAPLYRYAVLHGKAMDFASSVTSLGSMLLSTLEKQDAEHLSNMRAQHEVAINELMRDTRKRQVDEAKQSLATLDQQLKAAQARLDYYSSRQRVFPGEQHALDLQNQAHQATVIAEGLRLDSTFAHAFPNSITGAPVGATEFGGSFIGAVLDSAASVSSFVAEQYSFQAGVAERLEAYARRKEEWDQQAQLAKIEVEQVNREIIAAQIRLDIATRDLATTEKQIEQSREVEAFLRDKFTNEDLYGWMRGQLAAVYYQAYKLAYEMAKRAERAFQHERGDRGQSFVSFGYWDGLKQGLLAGEKLAHDLRRMDAAYCAQNVRELEMVKHVSLAKHAPEELLRLRESSTASFHLSEADFDREFNTHYLRRIKSASVSIPCVTGPYEGVLGKLTLLGGSTRKTRDGGVESWFTTLQSIVTSTGDQDAGLFELNFRDDRLLPFEGAGAHLESAKQWCFELSGGNELDYDSISDLVLHLRYTARDGSAPRAVATPHRRRLVRLRYEFADAWQAFMGSASSIVFTLPRSFFPLPRAETSSGITAVSIYSTWASSFAAQENLPSLGARYDGGALALDRPELFPEDADQRTGKWTATGGSFSFDKSWSVSPANKASLLDVWLILAY